MLIATTSLSFSAETADATILRNFTTAIADLPGLPRGTPRVIQAVSLKLHSATQKLRRAKNFLEMRVEISCQRSHYHV